MYCDPLEAQHKEWSEKHDAKKGRTSFRHDSTGLVTKGRTKIRYARVTRNGKIHKINAVYVRWDVAPFPQVTWSRKCQGAQSIKIFPVAEEDIDLADVCARCFVVRDIRE